MQLRRVGFLVAALSTAYVAAAGVSNLLPAERRALVAALLDHDALDDRLGVLQGGSTREDCGGGGGNGTGDVRDRLLAPAVRSVGGRRPGPHSLEAVALVGLGTINLVAAVLVAAVFSAGPQVFRFRWVVFGVTTTGLVTFCLGLAMRVEGMNSRQALLQRVVLLEQSSDRIGWGERQELSTMLAVLGRQRESRAIPLLPAIVGQKRSDPPDTPDADPPYVATPWRNAITRIAAEHRLVLIMEAHTVTEDRAWIEQTLGSFSNGRIHPLFRRGHRRIRLGAEVSRISHVANRDVHARPTVRKPATDGHATWLRGRRL